METIRCAKCGSEMESGFLVDIIFPGSGVSEPLAENLTWAKGRRSDLPRPDFFSRIWNGLGFLLSNVSRKPITGWRCTKCGYLEFYAP